VVGSWFHVAIVRSGSTVNIYKNGISQATATNSSSFTSTSTMFIGQQNTGVGYWAGSLSNVRIVKGTAVYTSSFSPPISPLAAITNTSLLTLQNATIIDNSTNAATITNSSSVTSVAAMPFTQSKPPAVDFLVVGGGGGCGSVGGGGGGGLLTGTTPIPIGSSLTVTVGAGGATGAIGASSQFSQIVAIGGGSAGTSSGAGGSGGGGNHSGNIAKGQGTFNQGNAGGDNLSGTTFSGGGGGAGQVGLNSKGGGPGNEGGGDGGQGVALPISGTMTAYSGGGGGSGSGTQGVGGAGGGGNAVSNATGGGNSGTANTGGGSGGSYAVSGGNGGSGIVIVSYPDTFAGAIATTGSPTVSTSGSGSYANNGSTTYLNYGNQTALHLGSGSFTVEMWLYKNANTAYMTACGDFAAGSTNTFQILGDATGSKITWYDGAGNAFTITSVSSIPINTWTHIAFVRNSTTLTLYINGVSDVSTTLSTNYNASTSFFVGQTPESNAGRYWNGYISNLRVVKGAAVYTSNFTPSTIPLTAITNTSLLLNTVSGAPFADGSVNSFTVTGVGTPAWNQLSPFATGTGYKNRVYRFTSTGSITF
jgi:hypothetical protein